MRFIKIKRRWLRRTMMVLLGWPFVLQYLWLGLRTLAVEFKACWDYEPPVDQA